MNTKLFQNGRLHSNNTNVVPFRKLHLQPTSWQCAVLTFLFLIASLANCRLLTHSANASWATPSNTGFCNEHHISIKLLSTTAPNNLTHNPSRKIVYSILKTYLVEIMNIHNNQSTNFFLKKRGEKIGLDVMLWKSSTAQKVFWPIPGPISYAGMTGRWGLLPYAQNAVRWFALSMQKVESAPQT